MALPNNKISTSVVATALGTTATDVGTLCKHPNITKWSKFKPIDFPSVIGLTKSQYQTEQYGIDVVSYTELVGVINFYRANNEAFKYKKPKGGELSPFRIGDFREYEHASVIPYRINELPTEISASTQTTIVPFGNKTNLPTNNIRWVDLGLSGHRLGTVTVLKGSTNPNFRWTFLNDSAIDSTNELSVISINTAVLSSPNTYEVYTFLKENNNERYYPIESGNLGEFMFVGSALIISLRAIFNIATQKVDWEFEIENTTGDQITLTDLRIGLRFNRNQGLDPFEQGEQEDGFGTTTIFGGETYSISGSFEGVTNPLNMYVYSQTRTTPAANKKANILIQA